MFLALLLACTCPPKEVAPPHTTRECADLYDPDRVRDFSIEIAAVEWEAIENEYRTWRARRSAGLPLKPYHPLESFRYRGELVTDAKIRLKGNPCCSWQGEKMQFVIAFNQSDEDGRFHGLRKLTLDAPFYDPTLLKERVALSYMEDAGLPTPCSNTATLTINDAYYGVYTNIEFVDREFLERQFPGEDSFGNLYKYDFSRGRFDLKNNSGASTDDLDDFLALETLEEVEAAFDLPQAMQLWTSEAMINQSDGFWAGSINFYLYNHPDSGWQIFPWDMDNAIDFWGPRRNPFNRKDYHGVTWHLDRVLEDPAMRVQYAEALNTALRYHDPEVLIRRVDAWNAQVRPLLAMESFSDFTLSEHDEGVAALRDNLETRDGYICGLVD